MSTLKTDYTPFACPNSKCKFYGQFGQNQITHHGWMGKNRHIQRLRCRECNKTFSENKGSLREGSKIDVDRQETLFKCFRWGVCDEGSADIAQVNIKTVRLFRSKVSKQSEILHNTRVQGVQSPGIQMDEIRVKQGGKITWAGLAIIMSSLLIVAVSLGSRNQLLADKLFAQIWCRCKQVSIFLTDGWKCYFSGLIRCYGRLYTPRKRQEHRGRRLSKRFKIDKMFYGQVIKQTVGRFRLCAVRCRAVLGSMKECLFFMKAYRLGKKIHTAHIERWFGSLRSCVASLRRKSRCLSRSETILEAHIWIYVALHNWMLPHSSLKGLITPAMAAGLTDHVWSYQEFIYLRIFDDGNMRIKITEKLDQMRSKETIKAYRRTKFAKGEEEVIWKSPLNQEVAA